MEAVGAGGAHVVSNSSRQRVQAPTSHAAPPVQTTKAARTVATSFPAARGAHGTCPTSGSNGSAHATAASVVRRAARPLAPEAGQSLCTTDCDGTELTRRAPSSLLYHAAPCMQHHELLTIARDTVRRFKVQQSQLFLAPDAYYCDCYRGLLRVRCYLPMENLWFFNLDDALYHVITAAYAEDGSASARQAMTNATSSVIHRVPAPRGRLQLSRAALKGWKRAQPPRHAAALTRKMLAAFCESM